MRVVALFRVSTEKQETHGASLDAQERAYREQAERFGWTTVAEFKGCESATQASSDRRVLQQVLACVREGGVDAIWVIEQSRLTRGDELEVAFLLRELEERDVKMLVNGHLRDLNSIDERFMVGVQSLVDRAESKRIKERMRRGRREKARQGKKTGGPAPYGYSNPLPGMSNRGTLQIVPAEAAIVRKIFEWSALGTGDRAIALKLNATGMPAPLGGQWGKSTVRRVLGNPAYIGTAANSVWVKTGKGFVRNLANTNAIVVPEAHKPIVDREVWDAVQKRPRLPTTDHVRLLTGMLTINDRIGGSDSNHGVAFYRGPRGVRGLPWIPVEEADEHAWKAFISLATDEPFVEALIAAASNPQTRLDAEREAEYHAEQIVRYEKRLGGLVTMRADGEITKDEYQRRRADIDAQVESAKRELAEQRAKLSACDVTLAPRVVRAIRTVLAGRTALTDAQRRAALRAVVKRVDLYASPTGREIARDERGRVVPGRNSQWAIERVTLRLALPGGPTASDTATRRGGQLATTAFDCVPLAEVVGEPIDDDRTGQSDTTGSCSALPAPARA